MISMFSRNCFNFSLWRTPNLCSSSITRSPKSLNTIPSCKSLWVPMTTSHSPVARCFIVSFCSFWDRKRDINSTLTPKGLKRSEIVWKCCNARIVVGTTTATCFPEVTALNIPRIATSVLPNPTSPQISLSIGFSHSMSALTSVIAFIWSGVSVYSKASSISTCHVVSGRNWIPVCILRFA